MEGYLDWLQISYNGGMAKADPSALFKPGRPR